MEVFQFATTPVATLIRFHLSMVAKGTLASSLSGCQIRTTVRTIPDDIWQFRKSALFCQCNAYTMFLRIRLIDLGIKQRYVYLVPRLAWRTAGRIGLPFSSYKTRVFDHTHFTSASVNRSMNCRGTLFFSEVQFAKLKKSHFGVFCLETVSLIALLF